ncbi:PAS domain S-box protein [Salinarimonas rosea]|uniref:PAS domain S-box protein n=1 Tax=Salinarimonas rosea TaxID=552063 RepID=UPI00040EBF74|nr:PAS domain S-box protein [Salinarimonas rosea]
MARDSRPASEAMGWTSWEGLEATLGVAAFEQDLVTGRLTGTRRFADLHGLDPSREITVEAARARVHPDDRARWIANDERLHREPGPYTTEFRVRTGAGVRRLLASGRVLVDADGRADRLVGIVVERPQQAVRDDAEPSFRACFEHVPVAVAKMRADGRLVFGNPALERLLGRPLPDRVDDLFGATGKDARAALQAIASGARSEALFEAPLAGGGGEVWTEVSVARTDDAASDEQAVLVFHDVTERRRVGGRLARSEERFRVALADAPTTVFEQDEGLRYLWIFNPHLEISQEDLVGRTDADFMDAPSAARVVALKRRAMTSREAVREIVEVRTHDGHSGVYDLFVEPRVDPGTGAVVGVACAATDVTDAARREAELAAQKERFRTSVESMLDCFGVYTALRDESGRIVDFRVDYVNDAACVANAMTREAQIGNGLCEILPGHRRCGLFDAYVALVQTGEPLRKESVFYSDAYAGRKLIRAFDVSAAKLGDGFVAVWRDVTDRKRLEVELADAVAERDRLLDQQRTLLRELDHRVKNNFQLLGNLLSLQAKAVPDDARPHLEDARQRLMTIAAVHDVLRVDPDQLETVSLREALHEMCVALRSGAGPRIALTLEADDVEVVTSQAVTVCMVVNEIATNALKYAFVGRDGGRVTIRALVEGAELHLSVRDDGVGYDPAAAREGLGTRLLERLSAALGGEPRVVSGDDGTRISFVFPLASLTRGVAAETEGTGRG